MGWKIDAKSIESGRKMKRKLKGNQRKFIEKRKKIKRKMDRKWKDELQKE